ncbi:MAG: DMT family transporter [candidate division KSB1 bacterium]|nr:DMT family transporter [candidate division KSB1 bacterium]
MTAELRSVRVGKRPVVGVLAVGVLAMSSASLWIRMCTVPAFTIAAYRLLLSTLAFCLGEALRTGGRTQLFKPTGRTLAAGLFLAFHFGTWIQSLRLTSVASSVLLVQTSPIFVAVASAILLSEPPSRLQMGGILTTLAGTVVVAGHDLTSGRQALLGDALALAGALGAAGYWICGRAARQRMDTGTYARTVYGTAAVVTVALAAVSGAPLAGFSGSNWLLLVLIALVPQGVGHTSFNWALKHLSATAVSVFALGEPVGASLLAYLFLGESPPPGTLLGGVAVLLGIYLTLQGERVKTTKGRRGSA